MGVARKARYVVQRLPFFLLMLKAVWVVLEPFGFKIGKYWFASEIQAHSLFFCFVLGYYAYIGRHCLYLKVCTAGLASLNLLNIAYYFRIIDKYYLTGFTALIFITCLIFALIHAVRKLR